MSEDFLKKANQVIRTKENGWFEIDVDEAVALQGIFNDIEFFKLKIKEAEKDLRRHIFKMKVLCDQVKEENGVPFEKKGKICVFDGKGYIVLDD